METQKRSTHQRCCHFVTDKICILITKQKNTLKILLLTSDEGQMFIHDCVILELLKVINPCRYSSEVPFGCC